MHLKNIVIMVFCLLAGRLFGQSEQASIRLLDFENYMPITQASFEYGSQYGISDEKGVIRFEYSRGTTMNLSHLNYGLWSLSSDELEQVIQVETYYRKSISVSIFPVTIIAVKPQIRKLDGEFKIEYQDRLEHDGGDFLSRIPAFSSIRKGGSYGFDPVFRGFKYDQLNIVLNGAQSATAACPNRMDPPTSQMALNMLDRIEVLKGPHSLRFGSGLGATINFIPAKLRFSSEPKLYGRLSGGYESNGNVYRSESQLGFSRENYDISLFASWSGGDDYKTGSSETVQADFSRASFGSSLGLKLSGNQQIRMSATYNRARETDFPALPMDLRDDDTWMFSVRHDIQLGGKFLQKWNSTLYGSFVNHLMNNLLKPIEPRTINAETLATTFQYGGRTESEWHIGRSILYAGADYRTEGASGIRVREFLTGPMEGNIIEDDAWQDGYIRKAGLFAEYQIDGDVFDYLLSGRMEFNSADILVPSSEFSLVNKKTSTTQLNPGFSLGILKNSGRNIQTGLYLARVQRSGGLTERFINYFPVGQDPYEMLGNPQLSPEVNYQSDLNFKFIISDVSFISVDLFAAYLRDFISSEIDTSLTPRIPMSPGVRRFINIDKAFKTGFELSYSQGLFAGLSHHFGLAYTYAQDLQRNLPLPEIAPLDIRYAIFGNYFKNKLKPELVFRYVAQQSRYSKEIGETLTPAFKLLDVSLAYRLNNQLSFSGGINNLLDENYYEHLNRSVSGTSNPIFAPGRNVFINLNFTF